MSENSRAHLRVLLVHSRVGGGHLSAARALATELEAKPGVSTTLVDAYLAAGIFPVTAFPAAYAELARHHPRLWSAVYVLSRWGLDPNRLLGPFLAAGLHRMVEQIQPDLIVSTLPVVNGLLATAARRGGAHLEVVLTDWHSVHRFWVARGVDHYTAPTPSARQDCIRFGADAAAVDVVGIPVRREFAQTERAADPRPGLGLDPRRFTILAMVGAEGSPRAFDNIARLLRLELDAQVIVVCGRNHRLRQQIERMPRRLPVRALGFVDNVAALMGWADVLLTKAGGLTLAEAFCAGVPVVVHDVLAGQEAGNLAYALGHQALVYAPDAARLAEIVGRLYADPEERAALAQRGRRLAVPDAAPRIAHNLLARTSA